MYIFMKQRSNVSNERRDWYNQTRYPVLEIKTGNKVIEPRYEKTGLRGFRSGPTQTGLYSHRRWPEAGKFVYRKYRDRTIRVAKTKALISFAVNAKLICVFVFAYANNRFSHDEAQLKMDTVQREHDNF